MSYIIALIAIVITVIAFTILRSEPAVESEITAGSEEIRQPENTEATIVQGVSSLENPVIPATEPAIEMNQTAPVMKEESAKALTTDTIFDNGSYTTEASYFTPRRTEHQMDITLTVKNDIVTAASILWDGEVTPKTPNHSGFDAAYKAEVVGQPLNEINLSRVGGASLTSGAFNEAIEIIQSQARTS